MTAPVDWERLRGLARQAKEQAEGWDFPWTPLIRVAEDEDVIGVGVIDEDEDVTGLDFGEEYGPILALRIAGMHNREPHLRLATEVLCDLAPVLEAWLIAKAANEEYGTTGCHNRAVDKSDALLDAYQAALARLGGGE